jgi:hypothetical protein
MDGCWAWSNYLLTGNDSYLKIKIIPWSSSSEHQAGRGISVDGALKESDEQVKGVEQSEYHTWVLTQPLGLSLP